MRCSSFLSRSQVLKVCHCSADKDDYSEFLNLHSDAMLPAGRQEIDIS